MFKGIAYADDVKPAITCMEEFYLVDRACTLLEKAAGVKLHRDPGSGKVKFLALGRWRGTLRQEDLPHQYVRLSDHLDFVGVELRSSFVQTRKANGDILQSRIMNIVGSWKAGRFMPLSQRAYSANCYALSKVWYRCSSINLRVQDHSQITSQVKSWLYQDLLIKPSELVLYRDAADGGLGLMNVSIRALALLIRSFLETSINPKYRHSLFHEHLFRYHVMEEHTLPNPGFTPYYDRDFFSVIAHYKHSSTLNIATMTIKQWYSVLLEDKVLMKPVNLQVQGPRELVPIRPELKFPETDWTQVWSLARTKGLGSELVSFQFKIMHDLLPTQERAARLGVGEPNHGQCLLCRLDTEDLVHGLLDCPYNMGAGQALLGVVQQILPDLDNERAVRLDFRRILQSDENLAVQCILLTGMKYIWETRITRKVVHLFRMRAEIEAKISILRKTRFSNTALLMENSINLLR